MVRLVNWQVNKVLPQITTDRKASYIKEYMILLRKTTEPESQDAPEQLLGYETFEDVQIGK